MRMSAQRLRVLKAAFHFAAIDEPFTLDRLVRESGVSTRFVNYVVNTFGGIEVIGIEDPHSQRPLIFYWLNPYGQNLVMRYLTKKGENVPFTFAREDDDGIKDPITSTTPHYGTMEEQKILEHTYPPIEREIRISLPYL